MPHGLPDWGLEGPKSTTYGLDDLGEHAVRLGSPHLWDRRGDVIWLTTFEEGLGNVHLIAGGPGTSIGLHSGYARQGAYCVKIVADDTWMATPELYKFLPYPVASSAGIESSFAFEDTLESFELGFWADDRNQMYNANVRYNHVAQTLAVLNDLGGWTVIQTAFRLRDGPRYQSVMKLVIDYPTYSYTRLIVGHEEFDLQGIPFFLGVSGGRPLLCGQIRAIATPGDTAEVYVDNVIVTQNEP